MTPNRGVTEAEYTWLEEQAERILDALSEQCPELGASVAVHGPTGEVRIEILAGKRAARQDDPGWGPPE